METALLGFALPMVFKKLTEILVRQGFIVQIFRTGDPVIVAYRKGKWYRKPKQLMLEFRSIDKNVTRIDITATIEKKKQDRNAEEILEEDLVNAIYRNFTPSIQF